MSSYRLSALLVLLFVAIGPIGPIGALAQPAPGTSLAQFKKCCQSGSYYAQQVCGIPQSAFVATCIPRGDPTGRREAAADNTMNNAAAGASMRQMHDSDTMQAVRRAAVEAYNEWASQRSKEVGAGAESNDRQRRQVPNSTTTCPDADWYVCVMRAKFTCTRVRCMKLS